MKLKNTLNLILTLPLILLFCACEDPIDVNLAEADPVLVVDAWVNGQAEDQRIFLTQSQPFFDSVPLRGVKGATVQLRTLMDTYTFEDNGNGEYLWNPSPSQPQLGQDGDDFQLTITVNGTTYESISKRNPVPTIDSITFRFEEGNAFFPDSHFAEFWSRDIVGPGNTYWIKAYKNGELLRAADEINIAFDGGFSAGGNFDGVEFIRPIRDAINPLIDDGDNGGFLSPYVNGDSVYVEIHSLTNEAFFFLNEVAIQTNRQGGFAELFAAPLSNVPTNIVKTSGDGASVVGFFNVASIATNGKRFVP